MEDLSELIVSLIIAGVIFVINGMSSKKKKLPKNQNNAPLPSDMGENEETDKVEELTWEDIFKELRKSKERSAQTVSPDEDDYIPRASQPLAPKPQESRRPVYQPLHPEGGTPIPHPITPIEAEEISDVTENAFDPEGIDWQQTVVASEILNRKYT